MSHSRMYHFRMFQKRLNMVRLACFCCAKAMSRVDDSMGVQTVLTSLPDLRHSIGPGHKCMSGGATPEQILPVHNICIASSSSTLHSHLETYPGQTSFPDVCSCYVTLLCFGPQAPPHALVHVCKGDIRYNMVSASLLLEL